MIHTSFLKAKTNISRSKTSPSWLVLFGLNCSYQIKFLHQISSDYRDVSEIKFIFAFKQTSVALAKQSEVQAKMSINASYRRKRLPEPQ